MAAESGKPATGSAHQYQEEIIAHWNGRSGEYDSRPHHGLQSQQEKEVWLETLRSLLPPSPADVLDVGTGTGFLALLLAGVEYVLPIYAEVSKYSNLMEQGITGNPDQLKAEELQEQAWPILEPHFRKAQETVAAKYREMLSKGLASHDIKEIIVAAGQGRVDSLFVAMGKEVWGTVSPEIDNIQVHQEPQPGDEDLLDLAALQTLSNSGTVFVVPPDRVPDDKLLAAVFRY